MAANATRIRPGLPGIEERRPGPSEFGAWSRSAELGVARRRSAKAALRRGDGERAERLEDLVTIFEQVVAIELKDASLRSRFENSPRVWPRRTNGAGRTRAGRRGSSSTERVWRLKSFRLTRRDQG